LKEVPQDAKHINKQLIQGFNAFFLGMWRSRLSRCMLPWFSEMGYWGGQEGTHLFSGPQGYPPTSSMLEPSAPCLSYQLLWVLKNDVNDWFLSSIQMKDWASLRSSKGY
jgi:hypothetical protein